MLCSQSWRSWWGNLSIRLGRDALHCCEAGWSILHRVIQWAEQICKLLPPSEHTKPVKACIALSLTVHGSEILSVRACFAFFTFISFPDGKFQLNKKWLLYLDCIISNFINPSSQGCRRINEVQLNWPAVLRYWNWGHSCAPELQSQECAVGQTAGDSGGGILRLPVSPSLLASLKSTKCGWFIFHKGPYIPWHLD